MTNQIKPGTLCYVVGVAGAVGLVVTAIGAKRSFGDKILEGGEIWEIDKPILWRSQFRDEYFMLCPLKCLRPIAGPGLEIDISEQETLGELAV